MSPATRALTELATGRRPAGARLLHTALLEGWGSQAYGEEAVLEAVRRAPSVETHWDAVEDAAGAALFGDDAAWFADLVDGHLRRVWRLGAGPMLPREPAVAVAFDPDLRQARGGVVADEADALEAMVGQRVLDQIEGFRVRIFPIRTVRGGDDAALLFAVYRMGDGPSRSCGFSYATARVRLVDGAVGDCRIVRDLAGEEAVATLAPVPRI